MSGQASPVPPVILDIPTLGRAVRLGELYDIRSGKFLGVQLYPQDKIEEVETDIKHTDLTVSLSTTHHQKAALLDISRELSLDILSGLVKVSGSASYLNDEKSNTNEYAYALALKMQLKEKRILFAEDTLGHHILQIVQQDYIDTKLATHFVSSITYGGRYIVNLVARQTEMSKEEKIEGKLQASFDKLKGAVSLKSSTEAKYKAEFENMDGKFDLIVHGDVAIQKIPITPKDVLDTFPEAASLIDKSGGIPISVTLQPIPPDLCKAELIHQIEANLVDTVLVAFSNLDDLRSRFLVLQDSAKRLRDFVPELARTIHVITTTYVQEHSGLLHRLAIFLQKYKLGEKIDHVSLLDNVNELYERHLKPDDEPSRVSLVYPSTLIGLEDQLSRIQYLVANIRRARESLHFRTPVNSKEPNGLEKVDDRVTDHSFYLSSLEDVCKATITQSQTLLFIMTPISGDSKHNLLILEYLAIVRKYAAYFEDSVNTAHMFYAENLDDLKRRLADDNLPDDRKFPELRGPSVVATRVDEKGQLTWDVSPPVLPPSGPLHTFKLMHTPKEGKVAGTIALYIDGINSKKGLTFTIRGKEESKQTRVWSYIQLLSDRKGEWFVSFHQGFGVHIHHLNLDIRSKTDKKPAPGSEFVSTFVQDIENQQWILYLDGDEIARESFTQNDLFPHGEELKVLYWGDNWWNGQLSEFKAFARALTKEEVKAQYLAWKDGQTQGA